MDGQNIMDFKQFGDNLAKYLKGQPYDTTQLLKDLSKFPNHTYSGYIFRGLYFNRPVDKCDIKDSPLCSWTTDISVAMNFASKGKYQAILIQKNQGIDIVKLLSYMKSNAMMTSESLSNCNLSKYEKEVIAPLNVSMCDILEPI